jgi:hypothetical protein
MELINSVVNLSVDECRDINGGLMMAFSLDGILKVLKLCDYIYDFGHGFYDGFSGNPHN